MPNKAKTGVNQLSKAPLIRMNSNNFGNRTNASKFSLNQASVDLGKTGKNKSRQDPALNTFNSADAGRIN
jgi:hypothetical protein